VTFGKIRSLPVQFRIFQCISDRVRITANADGREKGMEKAPMCPLCKIRERSYDDEPPGPGGYFSYCSTCTLLSGYREHNHTYYPSPAQVKAGTFKAGHSWRTSVSVHPLWEDGVHIGFRCSEFDRCGWERRFTVEELQPCHEHKSHGGFPIETIKGLCFTGRDHRAERGECDERGYVTECGREKEREREDAANWDPGRYIDRTPR
jgi:hypothetical protein